MSVSPCFSEEPTFKRVSWKFFFQKDPSYIAFIYILWATTAGWAVKCAYSKNGRLDKETSAKAVTKKMPFFLLFWSQTIKIMYFTDPSISTQYNLNKEILLNASCKSRKWKLYCWQYELSLQKNSTNVICNQIICLNYFLTTVTHWKF